MKGKLPVGRLLKTGARIPFMMWQDVRYNKLGNKYPAKPRAVNLLVNDICNSKCQMCYIWKQKRGYEITPEDLERTLQDPLFSQMTYVGVSGGEPTLRKDLPELFAVIAQKQPKLTGAGIITNAIQADTVISQVEKAADLCLSQGLSFSLMVSLDGIGEVHDLVRGRPGNFESVVKVIKHFQNYREIELLFGTTISKDNVWHVDEVLDFAREHNLYGRFRIAEFINRLYNDEVTDIIRNFTPLEKYHLGLFFTKLSLDFEPNLIYRNTYKSIRSMLMFDEKRQIKCPYQSHAVVLDSAGQLLYCSPKSPNLGSVLAESAETIYLDNISVRQNIIQNDCDNCIHDYHAPPTTRQLMQQSERLLRRKQRLIKVENIQAGLVSGLKGGQHAGESSAIRSAFIVGWYGTETAGDKAILGEIIYQLKQQGCEQVVVASLNPFLTYWTVRELEYDDVLVVDTYSAAFDKWAKQADETIMGGGPLMDIPEMGSVLRAFTLARRAGKRTRIAGCGVGPLNQPEYITAVTRLMSLSSKIQLRDSASVAWVKKHTDREDVEYTGDFAEGFVKRWAEAQGQIEKKPTLNCYLRAWSTEYKGSLSEADYEAQKQNFEEQLSQWIIAICQKFKLRPRLLAMHYFVVGGDDRDFNRHFAQRYLADLNPIVEVKPYAPQEILASMKQGALCLTMRFHSVLFAHTLQVPYVAVDYTGGGKISGFLADRESLDTMLTLSQVANGEWRNFQYANFTG